MSASGCHLHTRGLASTQQPSDHWRHNRQSFLHFYSLMSDTRGSRVRLDMGRGGRGDYGSPRTSPPSLHRLNEQLKRLKTSLSCLISRTHLFLINCPNNYTNGLMCQFAVTHEVPPPSELAKMHKKSEIPVERELFFWGGGGQCISFGGACVIIFIIQLYNRAMTAPIYLLSCCYETRLLLIGDFSAGCYRAALISLLIYYS